MSEVSIESLHVDIIQVVNHLALTHSLLVSSQEPLNIITQMIIHTLSLIKNIINGKNSTVLRKERNRTINDAGESLEF